MPVTFRDLIARNKRNSALLVVLFVLFTGIVALVLALAIVLYVNPSASTEARPLSGSVP